MRIAVASGKGGTGKTLLATHLAWAIAKAGEPVVYADADVEEPNGHLFLRPVIEEERPVTVRVPAMRRPTCSGCRRCAEACAFNALLAVKDRVLVMPELCHACGLCVAVCPDAALEERPRRVGLLQRGSADGIGFVSGTLDVGEARATPVVSAVVGALPYAGTAIIDGPPGASCPAMEALRPADVVVLVVEPTPFGLHDFEIAAQTCRTLGKPAFAVLNRADLGGTDAAAALARHGVPLIAQIPFDRAIAAAGAEGRLAADASPALREALQQVLERLAEQRGGAVR